MPLVQTRGAASAQGFGEFAQASAVPNYIEDVFSTWLYTGNDTGQSITNGIDLSGKGGLVWQKKRSATGAHQLIDTVRGSDYALNTNNTNGQGTGWSPYFGFASNGYTLTSDAGFNTSPQTYVSWTFRKQPKFFDVVTYTGNGSTKTISHSLGSVPGCIIVKDTSDTFSWVVYHRSNGNDKVMYLNGTQAVSTDANVWNSYTPTATDFQVGGSSFSNSNGDTYVAYVFAHDAGGFGLTGTDNVISCGSFTMASGYSPTTVTLGYEPQWVMMKSSTSTSAGFNGGWSIMDNMRGLTNSYNMSTIPDPILQANTSAAENNGYGYIDPTATGFITSPAGSSDFNQTFIYIAIRRGPMKVPTVGTSVFAPITYAGTNTAGQVISGANFPPDLSIPFSRAGAGGAVSQFIDRLRGGTAYLPPSSTAAEGNTAGYYIRSFNMDGVTYGTTYLDYTNSAYNYVNWMFRRAPSFFDEVCYTGTGANTTFTHNLGVAPELMIIKSRSDAFAWRVYTAPTGNTGYMVFNANNAFGTSSATWNNTSPTSSVFTVGTPAAVNNSGSTFVAYLFASVAGVSKVGSYTGTGSTLTVDCGFPSGVRFVMVKRTNNLGSWWVWDTARGMVSSTDPRLAFDSTSAETNTNWVYSVSTGFQVVSTNSEVNSSGDTYIFLAIA